MKYLAIFTVLCLNVLIANVIEAEILITEIMYNPASREKVPARTEWLELYNTGDETVPIRGWYLSDEDGKSEPFTQQIEIAPNHAIVLIPDDQQIEEFRKAWPGDFLVMTVKKWNNGGLKGLANNPTETNEILTLHDGSGRIIDRVNYDDNKPWPTDTKQGPSIYLLPDKLSTAENDQGKSWKQSKAGTDGARHNQVTNEYDKQDTGSPGFISKQKP
ncbi:hypothetical protein KS4_06430 [Poriferisphaera corsica]|uniref:LTD domain-containing protein n=1 Tax=Poriferisphaera corsica TaxID=2528020 RepID=A0A517YQV7_9BACT|nr:lamin tail domain-containing protein [Poriferisphaera corsica]QDU32609.1 hypothetical protein KS4_06430 [Poriferisphaera corsica]